MSKQEIRNKEIKILLNEILDHHSVLRYSVNLQLHLIASIYFFFLNCKYELKYQACDQLFVIFLVVLREWIFTS